MFTILTSTRCRTRKTATRHRLAVVMRHLRLIFITGPKLLFTTKISGKCAFIMMLMTAPSLLCCVMLTMPGIIFQSPQQQAYFYFSKMLENDPARWIVLMLAGICTLISLAVPAANGETEAHHR